MEKCECLLLQLGDGRCGRRRNVVYLSLIIGGGQGKVRRPTQITVKVFQLLLYKRNTINPVFSHISKEK